MSSATTGVADDAARRGPNGRPALTVALAQIAPVFLQRSATLDKVVASIVEAAARGAGVVAFGETLVPGYPVWLERSDGARFESPVQKALHARYLEQAVDVEAGDLAPVCAAARQHSVCVVLGIVERPRDRGGKTLYCSRVVIDGRGEVLSVHRKLMPTYEERLAWGIGDGAGLVVHPVGGFVLGALNCWENWMPLPRAALYAQGEDLHVALWPGGERNTRPITRFLAREGRSYCLSVSCLLRGADVPRDTPHRERFVVDDEEWLCDGGSCVAGPDGE
jgi:nitrilase